MDDDCALAIHLLNAVEELPRQALPYFASDESASNVRVGRAISCPGQRGEGLRREQGHLCSHSKPLILETRNVTVIPIPNLFVLGAGKCGTSTLHRLLLLHRSIVMSTPKEPSF